MTIDVQIFTGHKLTSFVFHWVTVSAFFVVLLSFKCDCDAVGRIQFGRAVIENFSVFDEHDIAEAELLCLSLLHFWYF